MGIKSAPFQNKGMLRDPSISKTSNEFAFENFNIRITAMNDETLLSVTNERGNRKIEPAIIPQYKGTLYCYADGEWMWGYGTSPCYRDVTVVFKDKNNDTATTIIKAGEDMGNDFMSLPEVSTIEAYIDNDTYSIDIEYTDNDDEVHSFKSVYEEPDIQGTLLGYSTLNKYLVLFTKSDSFDYIYRVEYKEDKSWERVLMFKGDLNFSYDNPIETLSNFETEDVQKVYWVDGRNQPRFINIKDFYANRKSTVFDFVTEFDASNLKVSIEKDYSGGGQFPSGVIQYAITFSNKFGQETNIAYVSDLNYISYSDRGATPEDLVQCSFKITVEGVDSSFGYLNLYSIQRTSINGTPSVNKVITVKVSEPMIIADNGSSGISLDPTLLLYMGGKEIVAGTMAQKDNTLFLGDLEQITQEVDNDLTAILRNEITDSLGEVINDGINNNIEFYYSDAPYTKPEDYYQYNNQLQYNSSSFKTFKGGEKYRFAVRFKTSTGQYTSSYWIGDRINTLYPKIDEVAGTIQRICVRYNLPEEFIRYNESIGNKYVAAELMMAEATDADRSIKAQGVISPTLFNLAERCNNAPFSIPSWYMRGRNIGEMESLHYNPLPSSDKLSAEIQSSFKTNPPYLGMDYTEEYTTGYDYFIFVYNTPIPWYYYVNTVLTLGGTGVEMTIRGLKVEGGICYREYTNVKQFYSEDESEKENCWKMVWTGKRRTEMKNVWQDIVPLLLNLGISFNALPPEADMIKSMTNNKPKLGKYKIYTHSTRSGNKKNKKELIDRATQSTDILYYHVNTTSASKGFDIHYINSNNNTYYIDESICSFHSPEIEKEPVSFDNTKYSFRIVGLSRISSNISDYIIEINNYKSENSGKLNFDFNSKYLSKDPSGLLTFPLVFDIDKASSSSSFYIYPWHKEGSISENTDENGSYAVLKSKTEANCRIAYKTDYIWGNNPWIPKNGISNIRAYYYDEPTLMNIDTPWGNKTYQGIYDTVLSTTSEEKNDSENKYRVTEYDTRYPIYTTSNNVYYAREQILELSENGGIPRIAGQPDIQVNALNLLEYGEDNEKIIKNLSSSPVRIKFKSTPHCVLSFNMSKEEFVTLPRISKNKEYLEILPSSVSDFDIHFPWRDFYIDNDIPFYKTMMWNTDFYQASNGYNINNNPMYFTIQEYTSNIKKVQDILNITDENRKEDIYIPIEYNNTKYINQIESINIPSSSGYYTEYPLKITDVAKKNDYIAFFVTLPYYYQMAETGELVPAYPWLEFDEDNSNSIEKHQISLKDQPSEFITWWVECTLKYDNPFYKGNVRLNVMNNSQQVIYTFNAITFDYVEDFKMTVDEKFNEDLSPDIVDLKRDVTVMVNRDSILNEKHNAVNIFYTFFINEYNDDTQTYKSTLGYKPIFDTSIENSLVLKDTDHDYSTEPYILIGELYVDYDNKVDTRYGGISDFAVKNNTFIPVGQDSYFNNTYTLTGENGDTYFQRWDCLKTYPYAEGDTNSLVDIFSCMIESHINLDGRSDNRRGLFNNVSTTPENMNIYNEVYSQTNNFYSSYILDEKFDNERYPNQITWSKEKHSNEDIDTWTNVTLASSLELDGDKGPIRSLEKFNNSLISFQDKGIAEILFNSRTQLATTQGVPIEIANSGKVDGKRYISDKAGCINKWSIVSTDHGIYFIDNLNNSISLFNGQIQSLSEAKGFGSWVRKNNSTELWTPREFRNFTSYYDKVHKDVYFIQHLDNYKYNTLCFNESLQQFVSFYDYGNVPMMTNVEDAFISFRDNSLWEQGAGEYSNIYGELQPFHMQYRITPDPYGDKTFTNFTYRADVFDMNEVPSFEDMLDGNNNLTDYTFDSVKAWNEYQAGESSLNFNKYKMSNLKKKFRIWRGDIPRASKNKGNPFGLNRIRNPWILFQLTKNKDLDKNLKMEFHDLVINYIE